MSALLLTYYNPQGLFLALGRKSHSLDIICSLGKPHLVWQFLLCFICKSNSVLTFFFSDIKIMYRFSELAPFFFFLKIAPTFACFKSYRFFFSPFSSRIRKYSGPIPAATAISASQVAPRPQLICLYKVCVAIMQMCRQAVHKQYSWMFPRCSFE